LKSVRLEPVERRGVFDKALLSLSKGSARTELILHRAGSISTGFEAVDASGLNNARYLEALGGLNVYIGYGAGKGTAIAPRWIGIK
jgi:predicted dinucleotide-binding enzyme